MRAFEFIGNPPAVDGKICEGFICESYQVNGAPIATAAVTYLKSCGVWHVLCFDPGIVHWRTLAERPEPQSFKEAGLEFVHADIGLLTGVTGVQLLSCKFSAFDGGIRATFVFEKGCKIDIEHMKNITSYSYSSI